MLRALEVDEDSSRETGFQKPLTAVHRSRIMRHLEKNPSLPRFGEQEIKAAIEDFAERIRFNSLSDYLNGLEWDGKMRMHRLFEHYFGATHGGETISTGSNYYLSRISVWFLTGLVRRALKPGCMNQYVAILSGPQGIGKSTGIKALCGDNRFTDRMAHLRLRESDPKRFYDALKGKWVVEIAEGKAIKGGDPDALKEFITQQSDEYIPPYASEKRLMPRAFVFVVTRNPAAGEGFLKDTTGNRRFWPIDCGKVLIDEIERDREQLLAEAIDLVRFCDEHDAGDINFYPDEDFEAEFLRPLQAEMVERNEWDDMVSDFLVDYSPDRVKPIAIIREVLGKHAAMPKELAEVGRALARTGLWRRAKSANGGYERIKPEGDRAAPADERLDTPF
jgi:predicted P-loop ATPase